MRSSAPTLTARAAQRASTTGCPKCEYAGRARQAPQQCDDGALKCPACGNRWRDLGPAYGAALTSIAPVASMRTSHRPGATPGKSRTGASPRLLLAACGVVAIAIGGVVAASIPASLPILAVNQGQGQLALSDIEIDRLGNPQEPALRVSGRITNTSDRPMPLVGVDFIVTSSTNSDSTSDIPQGWRHQPARDQLQPGQSILFSSAAGGIPALASPSFTNPSLANRVEIRVGETRLQQEF